MVMVKVAKLDFAPNHNIFFTINNPKIGSFPSKITYKPQKFKGRDKKSMPWWIGEEPTIITHPTELYNPSCEFRILSDLSEDVKEYFRLCSYALFPEILGTDQDKFRKPSLWLCSRFSIICANVRDFFTAGGTANIYVNDKLTWRNVPKVVANLSLRHLVIILIFNHTDVLHV